MMMKKNKTSLFLTSILYICGIFLFLEWIYPMEVYDDTSDITVFVIYALFCFLISYTRVKWWTSFFLKGFSLLFIINALYFEGPFLSKIWLQELYVDVLFNVQLLIQQHWFGFTNIFRSILLLLLIWLMSYLIYYWFFTMKRIFVFIVLTFTYVALLDTFTIYNGNFAMIRIFIISMIALVIANFLKAMTKVSIQSRAFKKSMLWIIPSVFIILLATIVGYASPKFKPQWPDPVAFITSVSGSEDPNDDLRKVGYGSDDSRLGGSFVMDDTPVFHARALKRHYWRIETKDVYTGKGWQSSLEPDYELISDGFIPYQTFTGNVVVEHLHASIEFQDHVQIVKLGYPYGLQYIDTHDHIDLYLDHYTGSIKKHMDENFTSDELQVSYMNPLFDKEMLRQVDEQTVDEPVFLDQYTQVPETLPDRVYELSRNITASAQAYNRYDQAKAIEQYFGRSGFQYQTTDIPYPSEDQDYVDQFLFDTQVGYCDNYSTSMVVMLRTLNIPARWVKGFTGGQQIEHPDIFDDGYHYYEVTNANAHSWVEVYFPNIGWVPFEPTQGFSNPVEFNEAQDDMEGPHESEEIEDIVENNEIEMNEHEPSNPEEVENAHTGADNVQDDHATGKLHWSIKMIALFIILGIVIVVYKMRFHWKTLYLTKELQKNDVDFKTFEKAYHHLLSILSNHGFVKKPDQTLREFAKYIDQNYETKEMSILTNAYERMLYNNEIGAEIISEQIDYWHKMIEHINS